MAPLRISHPEYLLRRINNAGGEKVEAIVFHLREQPLLERKFDPETSATTSGYADQFCGLVINEKSGSVGCAADLTN